MNKSPFDHFGIGTILAHTGCVKWLKGPKTANLKNSLFMAFANGNIFLKNFQRIFQKSDQIKVSYYLDISTFFFTQKNLQFKNQI